MLIKLLDSLLEPDLPRIVNRDLRKTVRLGRFGAVYPRLPILNVKRWRWLWTDEVELAAISHYYTAFNEILNVV